MRKITKEKGKCAMVFPQKQSQLSTISTTETFIFFNGKQWFNKGFSQIFIPLIYVITSLTLNDFPVKTLCLCFCRQLQSMGKILFLNLGPFDQGPANSSVTRRDLLYAL